MPSMSSALRTGSLSLIALAMTGALACGSGSGGATGQTTTGGAGTGSAGTGSGGTTTGAAGTGSGGTTTGAAGTGSGGTTTGAAGTGSAGTTTGAAGATAGTTGTAGSGATAGATGAAGAGTAGATGTAGTTGAAGASGGFANASTYTCNLLLGVSITYDWFTSGFEVQVDNAKWEAMAPTTPGTSFVETWADPAGATWSLPKTSACTQNSTKPERILFTAVNWTYTTAAEWVTQLDKFVTTAQAKFPSVVEIDLLTMMRAPNNMMTAACTSVEDVVQPYIDDAIQTVVAKYPKLVRAAPKVFAPDCAVFTGGGPHLTTAGKLVIAKVYGDVYSKEP
jgi:hypothetical protein